MIKLETTVILVSMLLSFILGVLLGGVLIYSKMIDTLNQAHNTNITNREILLFLDSEISKANKMCASEIHYFWKSQKEVILNQFDIKGEQ